MLTPTTGSNRDTLDFSELQRRERAQRIEALLELGVLTTDPRRWRPRWFDGRFLAASDLQAEQNYVLLRQADLARGGGSGVVDGLFVRVVDERGDAQGSGSAARLRIEPGQGVTATGELVTIFEPLDVDPADVPEMRRLDAAFGLQLIPNESGRNRTGLYVVALRPVEWTANPTGAYPTSLEGQRTVEDGTIVEGAAVALIPYPDAGGEVSWAQRRARAAREVFVEGRDWGVDASILPLAIVALRGNRIEWVDPYLVRRETGAERPAGMDFGFGARALREAHLLQYEAHLADALDAYDDRPFAASDVFRALPPVGRFLAATVDPDRLSQRFFPSGIDVELSFVPEDEVPAIVEEALLLPPLDLTRTTEAQRGTGVVVLVPLPRSVFVTQRDVLPDWEGEPPELRPNFLPLRALATPRELLFSRFALPVRARPGAGEDTSEASWQNLLRAALSTPLLWYVRRRHLPQRSNVAARPVEVDVPLERDLDDNIAAALERLRASDVPEVRPLVRRLLEPRFVENPILLRSLAARALGEGEPTPETVVSALVFAVDEATGRGLEDLAEVDERLGRRLGHLSVADTGLLADIDRLARDVPEDRLEDLAEGLRRALGERGNPPSELPERLRELRTELTS